MIPFTNTCIASIEELPRAKKIKPNFNRKSKRIKIIYFQAGFPINIINDVIHRFNYEKGNVLIPQWLFNKGKGLIRLPFAPANEKFVKSFINKKS